MMLFILNFLCMFSLKGMDKLPSEILEIVVSYSYDKELLKTTSNITDLYKSVKSLNRLARSNKMNAECVRKFVAKTIIEFNNCSLKELFNLKLDVMNKTRSLYLREWETPAVEWDWPAKDWRSRRYAARRYEPLSKCMINYFQDNLIDINQSIPQVVHKFFLHGSPKFNFFSNILPLQIACISSEIRDIRFILNLNADFNKKDFQGQNALTFLCAYKDIGYSQGLEKMHLIAKILVDNGIIVDMQDVHGKTALMYALRAYDVPCDYWEKKGGYCQIAAPHIAYNIPLVYLLLKASNNLNVQDNDGNTALFHALRDCHDVVIIDEFIAKGASVNIKNKDNETPLSLARKYYNYDSKVISRIESLTSARIKRLSYGRNNPLIHSLVGFWQLGSSILSYSKNVLLN